MRCNKCGNEIKDGVAFCEFCGAKQNGNDGLSNMLISYPSVYNSYVQTLKLIVEGNYDFVANAMRKTVEAMVDFIYSSCSVVDKIDKLNDRIEVLKGRNLITPLTYNNYTKLRLFGNAHSHIGNAPATKQECLQYLDILKTELISFVDTYSKVDYSKVTIRRPVSLAEEIVSRLFGLFFMAIGGFLTYQFYIHFYTNDFFSNSKFMIIFPLIFVIIGLCIFIGGPKVLKFIQSINKTFK